MPSLKFKVVITDPPQIIQRRIQSVIANKINLDVRSAINKARVQASNILYKSMYNSVEVQSLLDGDLKAELGVENAHIAIESILKEIENSFVIDFTPFNIFSGRMRGSVDVYLLPHNSQNKFISASYASYLTDKGVKIPWLEWLLTLGDQIIVRNYTVDFTDTRNSRTGLATMKTSKRKGWRVPPQFSGTTDDNFITRAMAEAAEEFLHFLKVEIIY